MAWGDAWSGAWGGAWGQLFDTVTPPVLHPPISGSSGGGGLVVGGQYQRDAMGRNRHVRNQSDEDFDNADLDLMAVARTLITSGILECL